MYIKYSDGLILNISDFKIPETQSEENSTIPTPNEILEYIKLFKLFVNKIEISNLSYGNMNFNVNYYNNYLYGNIKNLPEIGNLDLNSSIIEDNKNILLNIHELKIYRENIPIEINGQIAFQTENNNGLCLLNTELGNSIKLKIGGELINFDEVFIKVKSEQISSLFELFKMLQLPKDAFVWGVDKTKFENIKLFAETKFKLSKPESILDNLRVNGEIAKLNNRFEQKLNNAEIENLIFYIKTGNLYASTNSLKFGKTTGNTNLLISHLFTKPHLYIKSEIDKIIFDKTINQTIEFYSSLKELPVEIGDTSSAKFFMSLPLYETKVPLKFAVKSEINNKKRNIKSEKPTVSRASANYYYPQNIVKVSNVKANYGNFASLSANGYFDIEKSMLNLNGKIDTLNVENIKFNKLPVPFKIYGDPISKLNIETSPLLISGEQFDSKISNLKISIAGDSIEFGKVDIFEKELNLSSQVSGIYNLSNGIGNFDISLNNINVQPLVIKNKELKINLKTPNRLQIDIPTLESSFLMLDENKWRVELKNLSLISSIVKESINKIPAIGGEISLTGSSDIKFTGHLILSDQKILKIGDKFVNDLNISGLVANDEVKISANKNIFVHNKNNKTKIWIDGYDFNISGLNEYIDKNENDKKDVAEKNSSIELPNLTVNLKNGKFYFADGNNSYATSSTYLQMKNNSIFVKSKPAESGTITVETENSRYVVRGVGLRGNTISEISNFHGLSGGDYNLYIKGSDSDFDGLLQFGKLKIKDLELINNILAFINTVPALLTFSQPGFNHNGLRITAGYLQFNKKADVLNIVDLKVDGESVDLSGYGKIDFAKQKIDLFLDISAIKYIDKVIENIPIANYLILGDDGSIATRIHIKGDLNDPEISTELAKEIISTPFEIGKRAFNIPLKILTILKELNIDDEQNRENVNQFINNVGDNLKINY